MLTARIIGNNCKMLLNAKKISKETFAKSLGYSDFDVQKLCDGRLFTTSEDLNDIARFFDVESEELCVDYGQEKYVGDGFLHCMGQFKNRDNQEKILDIFDMYCDLKEALNK